MPYQPLVVVLAGVCAGIAADRRIDVPPAVWLGTAGIAWVIWLALWRQRRNALAAGALVAVLVSLGGTWHHSYWHLFRDNDIGRFAANRRRRFALRRLRRVDRAGFPRRPTIRCGRRSQTTRRD